MAPPPRRALLVRVFAIIASCAAAPVHPAGAPVPAPIQPQDDLGSIVEAYRAGNFDRAVNRLSGIIAAKRSEQTTLAWILEARKAERQADLEAALMLYSEAVMAIWIREEVYPDGPVAPYVPHLTRVLEALTTLDLRSPFLRSWYLLWEAFRQGYDHNPLPAALDFLDEALGAFPGDSAVQLAAGSRSELKWWRADENPRRDPRGSSSAATRALLEARDRYRRSLTIDPLEHEARLRLLRVLMELDELAAADKVIAGFEWPTSHPIVLYLARLFEGKLRERQGDRAAAARLYDQAIAQAPQGQSARIAKAHLAHASGARADAAAAAIHALSSTSTANDPWWVYNNGQLWRFDAYLERARRMVRR